MYEGNDNSILASNESGYKITGQSFNVDSSSKPKKFNILSKL
jgi:hypothetical protein